MTSISVSFPFYYYHIVCIWVYSCSYIYQQIFLISILLFLPLHSFLLQTVKPAVNCIWISVTFMVHLCSPMTLPHTWEFHRELFSLFPKAQSSADRQYLGQDQVFLTRDKLFRLECTLGLLMERSAIQKRHQKVLIHGW